MHVQESGLQMDGAQRRMQGVLLLGLLHFRRLVLELEWSEHGVVAPRWKGAVGSFPAMGDNAMLGPLQLENEALEAGGPGAL